jgi:hypothetical protein
MGYEYKSSKYLLPVNTGDLWDWSEEARRVDIIGILKQNLVNLLRS